ncbi:MAG: hypothetical protein GWP10_05475 [Nitrospiraceae bacterium]|nr:hypothetical protein [Nitrospiraceae bacterium]
MYESTVSLKKGVYWSDGNEFTADDVVFSYKLIKKYADQFGGNWSGEIYPKLFYDIQKVDKYTVKFYLTGDSINFKWGTLMMTLLSKAQWAPLVAKAEQGKTPAKDLLAAQIDKPVSIGPFIFDQWQHGAFAQPIMMKGASARCTRVELSTCPTRALVTPRQSRTTRPTMAPLGGIPSLI